MKISGNTILITGGGTGIGRELALQLKAKGNEVIICGRRENRLAEVCAESPGIHYIVCDVGNDADRRRLFAETTKNFPDINVVVNNGAYQVDRNLALGEQELGGMEDEVASIFIGPIRLNGLFIPYLMGQKDPVIVNTTSILGFTPKTPMTIYCSAKAGFHMYSILLRNDLLDTPIKVYEVVPPAVQTELNMEGRKRRSKPGEPHYGLKADYFASYVIKELEKGNLDIFCDEPNNLSGDQIKNEGRYSTEQRFLNL